MNTLMCRWFLDNCKELLKKIISPHLSDVHKVAADKVVVDKVVAVEENTAETIDTF
jgi:hypothetical protein